MKSSQIGGINRFIEAGENHSLQVAICIQSRKSLVQCNFDGEIDGKPVNAATDGREGESSQAVGTGNRETGEIATGEQLPFSVRSTVPHRANGVNDRSGGKPVAFGEFRVAGRATAEEAALSQEFRASGAMDCPVHASSAKQ